MKKIICVGIFMLSIISASQAQLKTPQPSTTQKITQDFGIGNIELSYSRPGVKSRKVYGDVVPFGKLWRTGANGPTRIKINHDITIGGQPLAIGEYSIFTIPNEKEWEIIVNKDPNKKNVFDYVQADDVLRFKIASQKMGSTVESFTIGFANVTNTTCDMQLMWDNTIVSIPLTTTYKDEVMKQITDIMGKDDKPYNSAATFYLENGGDKTQALEWYKKGVANNPTAYWILMGQAKCELALGKKMEAIATATKGMAIATKEEDDSYVKNFKNFLDKNK
jgi:hypothetical protein